MSLDSGIEPGTAPIRVAQLIIDALASCAIETSTKIDVPQPMAIVVKVRWTKLFSPNIENILEKYVHILYTYQAHRYSNEKFLQYAIL